MAPAVYTDRTLTSQSLEPKPIRLFRHLSNQRVPEFMLGTILGGRYEIIKHLGGGGFGQTYLAHDRHLPGQPNCVVKQLQPKKTDDESLQAARRLFDTEAEVLYSLGDHEQIPRLFAHFEENCDFFLVQEFIDGTVFSEEVKNRGPFNEAEIIPLLQDILTALEFVHQQNVIHRDIKPSNLIRRASDRHLVLIDFGAVKQIGLAADEAAENMTVTVAVGSSIYMPNEQLAGMPRFASDIYAVGVLAIQCLTGLYLKKLPTDPRSSEILWRDRAVISPELADFLDRMVRYDFRQRHENAGEALKELRSLTGNTSVSHLLTELKTSTDDGYLAWLERGDDLFGQQRYREAITAYNKVVQANPDDYAAWFKRGMALEHLQFYEDAISSYDHVLKLCPQDYLAWYKQGTAYAQLQRYAEAFEAFEQVVQLQPENYWAWHDRGLTLEGLERYEAAIASFDRAVQLKPDFQLAIENRKRLLSQLKQVDTLYHLQHYDEALVSCDRAIEQNPDDGLAWFMRGMALENLRRYNEAIAAYQRVLDIQPDDQLAWFKQAGLYEQQNQLEAALSAYHRVVQLQPENYWAWHDRGKLLEKLERFEEAIACYDRVIQLKSDFQAAIAGRARILKQLQHRMLAPANGEDDDDTVFSERLAQPSSARSERSRLRAAIDRYTQAPHAEAEQPEGHTVAHLPTVTTEETSLDQQILLEITQINALSREPEATNIARAETTAITAPLPAPPAPMAPLTEVTRPLVTTAIAESGDAAAEAGLARGRKLYHQQRYPEALAVLDQALKQWPNHTDLWRWRGNILNSLGRPQEAAKAYQAALQLTENSADLWGSLGGCLFRLRKFTEAIAAFDRATRIQSDHHLAWYWRGRALVELQQYPEALTSFEHAVALKGDFQPAIADYKRLKRHLKAQININLPV